MIKSCDVVVKRDRWGVYEYWKDRLIQADISDSIDHVWMYYHADTGRWTWEVSRYHVSETGCILEVLADGCWLRQVITLHPTRPLRETTLRAICKKYDKLSAMAGEAISTLEKEIYTSYNDNWWYYADRYNSILKVLNSL